VTVDPELCMASSACVATAPASFELGDDDVARPIVPPGDELELVIEAARACPTRAIAVLVDGVDVVD
jgi:ferredoxin